MLENTTLYKRLSMEVCEKRKDTFPLIINNGSRWSER